MRTEDKLRRVLALLLKAAQKDPAVFSEIEKLINGGQPDSELPPKSHPRNRRNPAAFDPLAVYQEGESALRNRLDSLDIEALRDVIAEGGMDPARLVLKWKSKERIVDHIMSTVRSRAQKGDAFRT